MIVSNACAFSVLQYLECVFGGGDDFTGVRFRRPHLKVKLLLDSTILYIIVLLQGLRTNRRRHLTPLHNN